MPARSDASETIEFASKSKATNLQNHNLLQAVIPWHLMSSVNLFFFKGLRQLLMGHQARTGNYNYKTFAIENFSNSRCPFWLMVIHSEPVIIELFSSLLWRLIHSEDVAYQGLSFTI